MKIVPAHLRCKTYYLIRSFRVRNLHLCRRCDVTGSVEPEPSSTVENRLLAEALSRSVSADSGWKSTGNAGNVPKTSDTSVGNSTAQAAQSFHLRVCEHREVVYGTILFFIFFISRDTQEASPLLMTLMDFGFSSFLESLQIPQRRVFGCWGEGGGGRGGASKGFSDSVPNKHSTLSKLIISRKSRWKNPAVWRSLSHFRGHVRYSKHLRALRDSAYTICLTSRNANRLSTSLFSGD